LSAYLWPGSPTSWAREPAGHAAPLLAFAALAALLIGWLSLRATGVYFVMVTFAFGQMLYYRQRVPGLGGRTACPSPCAAPSVLGRTILDLGDRTAAYAAIWVAWCSPSCC